VAVWEKPEENWLKCNVDGAIFSIEEKFGICFHDNSASLVQAHTMLFPFIASTIECEDTALQHALLIVVYCGFERVKFESDCQMIVNVVNNGCIYLNELEFLLSTCRSLISSNASYNLAFIWRQANRVAHSLARAFVL
jgi:hypothetical protein